jgi:DNA helicase II / ATP-dependent DNA helicase PcrA
LAFGQNGGQSVNDLLNQLNEHQRDAAEYYNGPSLIIAGAGSGKTRVLTYRIAYMISDGVNPSNILALTFTNKAAKEMKERISLLVDPQQARRLWMGTFHAVFSKILRYECSALGFPSDYTIYDSSDSKNLIKTIIKELNLDDKIYKPSEVLGRISMAKNNLITPEAYASNSDIIARDNYARKPAMATIFQNYANRCRRSGAMDFDDLLLNTNILFRNHPAILDKYRNAFRYILVDEYQDTNYSQYLIIKKLAEDHKNICVVGDDAQSIYSFRGARIENILKFQQDYPQAKLYKLERNYRSTQTIVDAANSLIEKNKGQIPKKVYSKNSEGDKIKIIAALTDNDEGNQVAGIIRDRVMTEHLHYKDFAILYRTNAQSRIFEESLRKQNIPHRVYGGMSFFQRKEVKDMLSYYRLVVNPADDECLKRIINYPLRGIGKTTIQRIEELANAANLSLWEMINNKELMFREFNKGAFVKISGFIDLINGYRIKAAEMEAFDLAYSIASTSGILSELNQDKTPEGISRIENLEELLNGIREFTENEENIEDTSLARYLQTVSLYTDADKDEEEDKNKVLIMTVHSAKGLEFKNIFIAGMEEELFPSGMSSGTPAELEEERRLFYVAVTRAMEKVYISYAHTRYKWGIPSYCTPSRFIKDIDEQFLDIPVTREDRNAVSFTKENSYKEPNSTIPFHSHKKLVKMETSVQTAFEASDSSGIMVGMDVEHERFGKGKVISKEGDTGNAKATIFFKDHGQKQLLLKFAKLKIIS